MNSRVIVGLAVATLIAVLARRAHALSSSGAVAAIVVGALAVAASWTMGALLVVYFVAASVLSRLGATVKERRTAPVIAKGGPRDATQVLANGGAFALAALGMLVWPSAGWVALAVGSLAASEADTWATEIGTLAPSDPRSVLTMRRVPPGTSGAVTVRGTLAAAGGAVLIAGTAAVLRVDLATCAAAAVGGFGGALFDSLIGAVLQSRRWCDACDSSTERAVHTCGAATRRVAGLGWVDNDAVNLISSTAGGLLALALAR